MANYNLTAAREAELLQAVEIYLKARRTLETVDAIPEPIAPTNFDEAYFCQDQMAIAYEEIGGWKIGGPQTAPPFYAPMPRMWMANSGDTLAGPMHRYRGLEAEISFLFGHDLPPRVTPYTREEVTAAVASAHPAIEVLESALTDPNAAPRFNMFGDMQIHGGFVHGPAIPDWQSIDWATVSVTLAVDGTVRVEKTASNPAGTDLLRLLVHLANECSARTGGIKAGQWVTTGSWTGVTLASAGSSVDVQFNIPNGNVSCKFA